MHDFLLDCIRLPFDWTTTMGYLFATFLQTVTYVYVAKISGTTYLVYHEFCEYLIAFAKDLEKSLMEFDLDTTSQTKPFSARNRIRFKRNLVEIIQFHAKAKQ